MRLLRWTLASSLLLVATSAYADTPRPAEPGPWKLGAVAGLNVSQSSFSSNWAGGDRGSIVWVLNSDVNAERQFSKSFNLANRLQLAYGQTSRQTANAAGDLVWDTPDKTTDLIAFESTGRFTLDRWADPYAALRMDSQFEDQSSPLGVVRFNPVKLKETGGIARLLFKSEDSEGLMRLGLGFRQTIARSIDAVTLEKQGFTSNDGGLEWQTNITRPVLEKKVLYKGQLLVFVPVFYSKAGALDQFDAAALAAFPGREAVADFWRAPDVSFQNNFSAAITKYLSVNLYAQLVYDKFDSAANVDPSKPLAEQVAEVDRNVRKAGQFKETLSLGLTYRLF
ncbi:MAG: DUF3078 domain-containing protein [Candidatus Eisenbacteria bacterium]|uniref:DUF3078 domain-containing protein n=1 Tax=Eiseniibacteriota bacterium TaxID=2212470 RepID=A0A933W7I4_UNCEI|nr:DUF3078 domain-containing protein [Candidatus Eisenbacteria bacterium]